MATRGTVVETSRSPEPEPEDTDQYAPDPLDEEVEEPLHADPEAERVAAIEIEARAEGWRPLAEYRGAPGSWKTAEEFLKRGREILPIVQRQLDETKVVNQRLAGEVTGLRQTVEKSAAQVQRLLSANERAEKQGYERAVRELRDRQREAAAAGDMPTYDQVTEQISELDEQRAAETVAAPAPGQTRQPAPQPEPRPAPQVPTPEVDAFVAANPWFMADPVLNEIMQSEHKILLRESPGLPLAENLEEAKRRVMARYPSKFRVRPPGRQRQASVNEPSGGRDDGRQPVTGFDTIADPAERAVAKREFQRLRNQDPSITEVQYLTLYNDPKADVTQLQNQPPKQAR